jgi:hypothetical protein
VAQPDGEGEGRSAFGLHPPFTAADPVAYGADLHLLVGRPLGGRGEEERWIVEVLADRNEGRIGRWADFAIDGRFQLAK